VTDSRLPLVSRLAVVALGSVDGRVAKPVDPVAEWMLASQPSIKPSSISQAAYSTIRARAMIIDRMILDEVHLAEHVGRRICVVSVGPGLDARWHRLLPAAGDVVVRYLELESPKILSYKDEVLKASPFATSWSAVATRAHRFDQWDLGTTHGAFPLVVLDGLSGRLSPEAMRDLLSKIRMETPDARLIAGLPGYGWGERVRWTVGTLRELGWVPEEDILLGPRQRLGGIGGDGVCPGMYPQRILRLRAGLLPWRALRA
jgi:O-methyltransferase involved in polyketide biosynthesis